ncbi:MAG: [protein-PII] uridylyltransferase [Pseudomonadota bacterium]
MLISGGTRSVGVDDVDQDATVASLRAGLDADSHADYRTLLATAKESLAERFRRGEPVETLVAAHASAVDAVLLHLWDDCNVAGDVALVAVGGFGRGELHPESDVDIMIVLADDDAATEAAGAFITRLWDCGIEIGHSVRTLLQCEQEARDDVTVTTTLMESRLLCGPPHLFEQMLALTASDNIWDSRAFYLAKRDEQRARHARYGDTGYNLEPNVKGSPGGLRDIQMVGWIARRHFGVTQLATLPHDEFLTEGQVERLIEGRHFLWTIRYALHVLTGRREDRLLFDHQKNLAALLGYEDARFTLGVEQMMQRYYRTVMELSRLNEMLLQLFEESILLQPDNAPVPIDENFVNINGYLSAVDDDIFVRDPTALLSMFTCMQAHPSLNGVSAGTIRLLRRHLHLIDEQFRQHPRNHREFLALLGAEHGVTRELRRMNRYGVLGLYIPAFERIVGRMQYDLFHAYTVDEHTLFVVSNLRRFALARFDDEYPHCSAVMRTIDNPVLAYLAGLFHDIAKGRGGDHSELGAIDALAFCREHGIADDDAALVSWLVANHLVLSMTAQKKDISDPDVISTFAKRVGDQRHLDYLYVLTAADVRGTNPKMWNSWKSQLFQDLYEATKRALHRGLENPVDKPLLISDTKRDAHAILSQQHDATAIDTVWATLPDDYFLRHSIAEVVWHTEQLVHGGVQQPQFAVQRRDELNALTLLLYTPRQRHTFAAVTASLDELGMSVIDARIEPTHDDFSLDTYIVIEPDGGKLDEQRIIDVQQRLEPIAYQDDNELLVVNRRLPRRQRMFDTDQRIQFRSDMPADRTVMEITVADHPGLLMKIGELLIDLDIYINAAKIVTIGERAEDVFYLTNTNESALGDAECEQLRATLLRKLSGHQP